MNEAIFSSQSQEWGTPKSLYDLLNKEFRFDLDVCASESNHKNPFYLTKEDNSLSDGIEWNGKCWMNPPYGKGIIDWVEKAWRASTLGATVVCLLPVRTDTKWWHEYVMESNEIRLLNRRISFDGPIKNKSTMPVCIVIFNGIKIPRLAVMDIRGLKI